MLKMELYIFVIILTQDSIVSKEEDVVSLKEELAEIQKKENKLKAEKFEVDQKIDSINKDIHENEKKIPALRKQVRNSILHPLVFNNFFMLICHGEGMS
jgi:predicted  nucleic acid-binding Zn-ribbon protein